jgi:hypothetical protein
MFCSFAPFPTYQHCGQACWGKAKQTAPLLFASLNRL